MANPVLLHLDLLAPQDLHSLAYVPRGKDVSNPYLLEITNEVCTSLSFSMGSNGSRAVGLDLQNVTAGISALMSLFPAAKRPSPQLADAIFSELDINEPIGLTIMLASLYAGKSASTPSQTP